MSSLSTAFTFSLSVNCISSRLDRISTVCIISLSTLYLSSLTVILVPLICQSEILLAGQFGSFYSCDPLSIHAAPIPSLPSNFFPRLESQPGPNFFWRLPFSYLVQIPSRSPSTSGTIQEELLGLQSEALERTSCQLSEKKRYLFLFVKVLAKLVNLLEVPKAIQK